MTLSDLLQGCLSLIQSWYNKNVTRLTTQGCSNIVISWLLQLCWHNLVTSLITSTRLLQFVNSLFQTCWQLVTSRANTTCRRLVCRLATSCEIFTSRCVLGMIIKLTQSRFLLRFSFWWMRKSGSIRNIQVWNNALRTFVINSLIHIFQKKNQSHTLSFFSFCSFRLFFELVFRSLSLPTKHRWMTVLIS